jgi:basic membrane protein A and related proteins
MTQEKFTAEFNRRDVLKGAGAALALGGFGSLANAQAPITVGFIYVGPKDDFGYNQAHAEAVAEIKKLPGIKAVEEENVPETTAVQKAMQGMIS